VTDNYVRRWFECSIKRLQYKSNIMNRQLCKKVAQKLGWCGL